ncbi:MAG: efflux RND transporter permease subunit [Fibrobacteres bacterium]|nr:efflux RND transporter permease subunit [Fibrobacterota bacterium]
MKRIIQTGLNNKILAFFIVACIVLAGTYSVRTLSLDAFPDVSGIQVEILSSSQSLSPLELEKQVTYPVEIAMRGLSGLTSMRSTTKYGLSVVVLVFDDNTDIYFARQQVFERLSGIASELPEGVEQRLGPIASALGEIYHYTLTAPEVSSDSERVRQLTELRTLQDWVIAPALMGVAGVNEINAFGGYVQEYLVEADPYLLLQYQVSMDDLLNALKDNNQNSGAGFIVVGQEQHIVRGTGSILSLSDINGIFIKSRDGVPIHVRDVAKVSLNHAPRQGLAMRDGKGEAVGGIVLMLRGQNSMEVVQRVVEKAAEINKSTLLPPGVQIKPYYVRSDMVKTNIRTVVRSLIESAVLVIIVLYLLLGNLRGAAAVLLVLPLSMLLTFVIMKVFNMSANLMSLGGLAISLGMIIDATIIQVENVQRHLLKNETGPVRIATVLKAVVEVRKPSIFGELIIALTFIPILTLQGMEGKMFSPLALTVAIALIASLFLSIFVVPTICLTLLKPSEHEETKLVKVVKRFYFPALSYCIAKPKWVTALSLFLLLMAGFTASRFGREFIPVMDEGAFDMDIALMPGISLERSAAISLEVEKRLMRFPELVSIVGKTGQTGIAVEARGVDKTGYVGILKPKNEWTSAKTKEELFEKMRDSLADISGMVFSFSQPVQCRIDELVSGTRSQLIAKLSGPDMDVLKEKAEEISSIVSAIPGAADVVPEKTSGQPYVTIQLDKERIARYGCSVKSVLSLVSAAIGGEQATRIQEGNRVTDVTVRLAAQYRNSPEQIGSLLITADNGGSIPLREVADIVVSEGPVQISREDGSRRIGVEVNISGRDIASFVEEADKQIREKVNLPSGYLLSWGGQFENQQQAMKRFLIITPLAIALILLLLYISFNSIRMAMLVLSTLPFALIGGVFALKLSGLYLSVPASVGFIVLFGVSVLNSLVLISYITELRKSGQSRTHAITQACTMRLRPILMTAAITVFSLIPMLYATGPGSEIQKPLAVVVVGGLLTATLATLLVLPTLYRWFESSKDESM